MTVTQHPPVGPMPTNSALLLSGLLWSTVADVLATGDLVGPDDLDEPHSTIYAAIRACADQGETGPRAVLDRLVREGNASQLVRDELVSATTAGGIATALPLYAAQVLAERFRIACESYGHAVVTLVDDASEADLWQGITSGGARLRTLADRLAVMRGGEL